VGGGGYGCFAARVFGSGGGGGVNTKTRTPSKPIKRSDEVILIGYFLSRCTDFSDGKKPRPPKVLNVDKWTHCYDLFFLRFADGRGTDHFRHTLRNTRDIFDSLFQNGRTGWSEGQMRGQELSDRDIELHQTWKDQSDDALEKHVMKFAFGHALAK
jgi:5-methylcytosine-specific restriction protein A